MKDIKTLYDALTELNRIDKRSTELDQEFNLYETTYRCFIALLIVASIIIFALSNIIVAMIFGFITYTVITGMHLFKHKKLMNELNQLLDELENLDTNI